MQKRLTPIIITLLVLILGMGLVAGYLKTNTSSTPKTTGTQVSLTGTVYEDKNCNDVREPDEKGLPGVKVNVLSMDRFTVLAELTTDSSGFYKFKHVLSGVNSITVRPYSVPLDNYGVGQFPARSTTLNANQNSINMDLGQVPAPVGDRCP